jgi:hypothetical protein
MSAPHPSRRDALRTGFFGLTVLLAGDHLVGCRAQRGPQSYEDGPDRIGAGPFPEGPGDEPVARPATPGASRIARLGPLGPPDANGVRLPQGFTSRVVARSGEPVVAGGSYRWHPAPDGGAVFPADDGGWVYVSNAEVDDGQGGAGALRFDAEGVVRDGYPILTGTRRNCAGGPTPWRTWLSCEEVPDGVVYECDPFNPSQGSPRLALGVFCHEAVAVDPVRGALYLTEDRRDGRLYRFTPSAYPSLREGRLEVMRVRVGREGAVDWMRVPDPLAQRRPTRLQVRESTAFNGGEGIWYHDDVVYFTTKGDHRVWAYDVAREALTLLYDVRTATRPILSGVDNVTVSPGGDVLVAEDGGNQEVVALSPGGHVNPVLQLPEHDRSEITGPAFDPSFRRLYFSSQRGAAGRASDGVTYEVSGPFFSHTPRG